MNDYSPPRSLLRPLLGYVGLAVVMILISHVLTLLLGVRLDVPIMSYGIVSGVICGLAIWIACGRGHWSLRFSVSLAIVLSLSVWACWSWDLIPRTLFRGPGFFFGEGRLTAARAALNGVIGFLFVWAPLQVASVWLGWRLDIPSAERSPRDGRRLRMRLLAVVVAVLIIATIVLRIVERSASLPETVRYLNYLMLFPLSAMFSLLYVPLVWGWLVSTRLRYSFAASIPYGLFFIFFVFAGGLSVLGWLLRGPILLHGFFFFGALFLFRQSGWQLVPYSRAELIRE